jgi:hypothetical protein
MRKQIFSECLKCANKKWQIFDPNVKRIQFLFQPQSPRPREALSLEKSQKSKRSKFHNLDTFRGT